MDDDLNLVRQQITDLRAEMYALEAEIRLQVLTAVDFIEPAYRLLDMRKEVVRLIGRRNDLGGREVSLPYKDRFSANAARPPADRGNEPRT